MSLFCALFFAFFIISSSSSAVEKNANNLGMQTFIVRIHTSLKPSTFADVDEWYESTLGSVGFNPNQQGGAKSSYFLHVYRTVFHGFSARLTPEQAKLLKAQPGVIGVLPDQIRHVETTRSPGFLGLDSYHNPKGLLRESDLGSNVVIGMIDTGIWPESPSFSDEGLGPIPAHFKGECDGGVGFPSSLCNKKLVGVRYFSDGLEAIEGPTQVEERSARDSIGHGTHTASTAAGRARAQNASFFGYAKGEATGIAPKARLAIYKVCWKSGCAESDILAGFDKAVQDGVDIISLSVGGPPQQYPVDPIAIGSFGAVEKGIFVSASAGNSGPNSGSVSNVAPWITTVGASTIDRAFLAELILGNGVVLTGTSLYTGKPFVEKQYFPIIYGRDARDPLCLNLLDPEVVKGKIVVCNPSQDSRVVKGLLVKRAGGIGVVIASDGLIGKSFTTDPYLVPELAIPESANDKLFSYLNSTKEPKATIVFRGTRLGSGPAPAVAGFSSRGPNKVSSYVLKPDVIAPGVDILAAWPDNVPPSHLSEDPRRSGFNIISGTSMSCPHVSGVAALIKGAHPEWSPAMIRSALMTTSYNHYSDGKPLVDQVNYTNASIWDMGVGHVDPEKANDPGLVFDLGVDDYIDFLCASNYSESEIKTVVKRAASCNKRTVKQWDLNYPAIVVDSSQSGKSADAEIIVKRALTSVGPAASSYSAKVANPRGANVTVSPPSLSFKEQAEKQSFTVHFSVGGSLQNEVGWLTWTDGRHNVTIPLIVS